MSTVDRQHRTFVQQMILTNGDQVKSYKKAYPKCKRDETARVNSYKLLQNATIAKQIQEGLQKKEEAILSAQRTAAAELAAKRIITEAEIDAALSAIVRGEVRFERKYPIWTGAVDKNGKRVIEIITTFTPSDAGDITQAASLLYKRKGSFAPKKIQLMETPEVIEPGDPDEEDIE